MTDILGMDEECNRHIFSLLFQVLPRKIIFFMTGSVRKDRSKERTGHLIFLFLLSGYRSCRQCILSFFVMAAMTQLSTEDFGVLQVTWAKYISSKGNSCKIKQRNRKLSDYVVDHHHFDSVHFIQTKDSVEHPILPWYAIYLSSFREFVEVSNVAEFKSQQSMLFNQSINF